MALINCDECNKEVSDKAASCPHCGAPIAQAQETKAAGSPLSTVQETCEKFEANHVDIESLAHDKGALKPYEEVLLQCQI